MITDNLFPFAAVIGQENVKRALLIALVNPKAGGLLIGGQKGTAKSTIARSVIDFADATKIVELPLNATEDMLFGSIDIEYAVRKGEKKFSPGILARANGNILYIDEANLLRTELLTAVLDTNATGVNVVERDGISFRHPAQYIVIGTMNPEEGTLASQILDRFGMYAEATSELEIPKRVEIMRRLLDYSRDRKEFRARYKAATIALHKQVKKARAVVAKIEVPEAMMQLAAQICAKGFCAGHRAEIFLLEAAKAIAALNDRDYMMPNDVEEAAQFVLPHRMRKPPEQPEQPEEQEQDEVELPPPPPQDEDQADNEQNEQMPMDHSNGSGEDDNEKQDQQEDGQDDADNNQDRQDHQTPESLAQEDQVSDIDMNFTLPKMVVNLGQDRNIRRGSGKRSVTRTDLKQGRYVRANIPAGKVEDLAFDATIRAAAPFQQMREKNGCALTIKKEDLRQKVREKRIGNTFLFVVDASGSMGARERMRAVKGAIFFMLHEAYQKRDRVGMIAFRRQTAEVILPITRSVDLAQKCLRQLPTGGKTPLAEGLSTAFLTLATMNKKDQALQPIMVLVTDGRANATEKAGGDPVQDALTIAGKINQAKIHSIVIDTETDFIKLGVAKAVAKEMGATYYRLKQLSEEKIIRIVSNFD